MGSSKGRGAFASGGLGRTGGDGGEAALGERAPELPLAVQRRPLDALNAALLEEICAINAAGVELLVQRAAELIAAEPPGQSGANGKAGAALPPGPEPQAWLALDGSQRHRLAAQPLLLFGIGFEDGARWQVLTAEVLAADSPRRIAESRPRTVSLVYARLLVHYAWHLARTAPLTAGLVAGMAGVSAAALRAVHVEHLDALADRSVQWLRPRWMDAPSLWDDLLRAARCEGGAGLARGVALRAVQRAGAALAAPTALDASIDARAQPGGGKIPTPL